MEGIGLKDILALAMKGYKLDEIKELVSLGQTVTETEKKQEETPAADPDTAQPEQAEEQQREKPDTMSEDSEQLKAKIIQLEDKIKVMQEENTRKEVERKMETDEEKLRKIVQDFL